MGAFLTFLGVVIAIVVWYRRWTRTHNTVMSALKTAKTALDKREPRTGMQSGMQTETLEKDPKTGVYRPKERG
jgi:hypothetical protein